MRRNLSGIFFREKINGKWENVCFEECSEEKQRKIFKENEPEFVENLAIMLGDVIKRLGDEFDIISK
jgi:hypothetical protein